MGIRPVLLAQAGEIGELPEQAGNSGKRPGLQVFSN
jgi:hypothetical protein